MKQMLMRYSSTCSKTNVSRNKGNNNFKIYKNEKKINGVTARKLFCIY